MAVGFKVADAFIEIHVDDDTRTGRHQVERDTTRWADKLGLNLGGIFGRGIMSGIGRALAGALVGTTKLAALGLVAGVVSSAIAGLAGALVNLLPYLHELVATAVSAAGALLLLPGAMIALKLATATAKLALSGFSDAMKALWSGSAVKLKEALKELAPEAQRVVREIKKLIPALKSLRLDVQNAAFAGLAEHVRKIGLLYLPVVRRGLVAIASVLNGAIKDAIEFLSSRDNVLDIGRILGSTTTTLDNLRQALTPLLQVFRDIAVVSSQVLAQLTGSGFLGALNSFAELIKEMRESGALADLITDGVAALKQFVGLAVDLLGILKGILTAAGGSGGLFAFFDRLNKLINSAGVQKSLGEIFDALSEAATALTPVLVVLFKALVPVIKGMAAIAIAFAPGLTILVELLGGALASLAPAISGLAPLLSVLGQALLPIAQIISGLFSSGLVDGLVAFVRSFTRGLQALVPVAPIVGKALGDLLTALAPILEVLGPLLGFVLTEVATALAAVARAVGPLIALFSKSFAGLIERVTPVMLQLAEEILPVFAEVGLALAEAFAPLVPVFAELARIYVDELKAHLPAIVEAFRGLIRAFGAAGIALVHSFVEAMLVLAPALPEIVLSMVDLAKEATEFLKVLTPLLPDLTQLLIVFLKLGIETGLFQLMVGLLIMALRGMAGMIKAVTDTLNAILAPFRRAKQGAESFGKAVSGAAKNAIGTMRDLGTKIRNAVSNFGSLLVNAGKNVIRGLIRGIREMFPNLAAIVDQGASLIRSFWPFSPAKRGPLSGRGDMLFAGRNIATRLADGMRGGLGVVSTAAERLAAVARFGPGTMGGFSFAGAAGAAMGGAAQTAVAAAQERRTMGPYRMELDGRVLTEFVIDTVTGQPKAVAAATDEGRRERSFIHTPRARV